MDIEEASKEVLYDWEQKVSDEWLKRNKRAGEAYRSANSLPIIGIFYNLLLIIFSALLYVLYKLQLPYEMFIWILLTIYCMYYLNKYMAISELNILGKPATPIDIPTSRAYWANQTPGVASIVATHSEFIKYIKHIKIATYLLGLFVTVISLLIYFIWGSLRGSELALFILGVIVFVIQMFHMSIRLLNSIDERSINIHNEMMELADEMEKEGLITRDSEDSEDGFFSNLVK